jgi:hypothetical protein
MDAGQMGCMHSNLRNGFLHMSVRLKLGGGSGQLACVYVLAY